MNSAISYLRPHGSQIVIYIYIYFLGGAHFLFFFVFLIFVSSLSHHFSTLFLSLCSTSLPPNPWLTVNDHPNHKPMVDLWLTPNQPPTIIATAQGERTVAAHDEQRPHGHSRDLNEPTATHAIWSHPRQSTVIWTHPRQSEPQPWRATTTISPRQSESHVYLKLTSPSWERGEAFTARGREERAWWV